MPDLNQKRVLVVSGDPRTLAEIKRGLMRRFTVALAAPGEPARAQLAAHGADALVAIIEGDGWGELTKLCDHAARMGIPALFLAKDDDERDELRAFSAGAADYAIKRDGYDALIARLELRIRAGEAERGALSVEPGGLLAGRTILIAEDVELNRQIMEAMFSEAEGMAVDFAENGLEALEMFIKAPERYLAVFLDIHMPKMGGLDASRAIRSLQSPAAREVAIYALSASDGEDEIRRQCAEAGMDGFVQKPVEYEAILNICVECAARAKGRF